MTWTITIGAHIVYCVMRPSFATTWGDSRIQAYVWNRIVPEPNSGCWLWTGYTVNGYGRITFDWKNQPAHRFVYEALVAKVPPGLEMDHLCRTECCVNPSHLEPVTPRENTLRSNNPAAKAARQTECKYGHRYTPESVRVNAHGHRYCRICEKIRSAYRIVDGKRRRIPTAELMAGIQNNQEETP